MANRTGEKVGWTVGWLGGFIWVAILSVIFLIQDKWIQGVSGLVLVGIAVLIIIISLAPWRHSSTPYWKLMIPPYVVLFVSVAWAVWSYGGVEDAGLKWWNFFWVVPLLIPFGSVGRRKWKDFNAKHL